MSDGTMVLLGYPGRFAECPWQSSCLGALPEVQATRNLRNGRPSTRFWTSGPAVPRWAAGDGVQRTSTAGRKSPDPSSSGEVPGHSASSITTTSAGATGLLAIVKCTST